MEIYFLIQVGSVIGAAPAIGLCLLTAAIGIVLLRLQGLQTALRARERLDRGEIPAVDLLEGIMLLLAGAFLLTPGFFTDFLGFLCLVPPLRRKVAAGLLARLFQDAVHYRAHRTTIVEGEHWHDDDDDPPRLGP